MTFSSLALAILGPSDPDRLKRMTEALMDAYCEALRQQSYSVNGIRYIGDGMLLSAIIYRVHITGMPFTGEGETAAWREARVP